MPKKPRPHMQTLNHYLTSLPPGVGISLHAYHRIKVYAYAPLLKGYAP